MNSYPFNMSGLLLPPPPPPPPQQPLPSTQLETSVTVDKVSNLQCANGNEVITSDISSQTQQQLQYSIPNHHQTHTMHHQNYMPDHSANTMNMQSLNNPSALMMIPASQLSLPPPPPPPPPTNNGSMPLNAGGYSQPIHSGESHSNFMRYNNDRPSHPFQRFRPPRGGRGGGRGGSRGSGPPMWAHHKQTPSGLKGPWKSTDDQIRSEWTPEEMGRLIPERQQSPGIPGVSSGVICSSSVQGGDQTSEHLPVHREGSCDSTSPSSFRSESCDTTAHSGIPTFTPAATTYKDHKVNPKDPSLPKELTELFEALNCKLCEVVSSSTVQAKLHYSGKPHEKKVRQWLQRWSDETGLPLPKRPKIEAAIDIKPGDLYCELCEVAFTSVKHGEQHKMGKPHQKALQLGYNPHKKKKKVDVPLDPTGRFGIGEEFQKDAPKESSENNLSESSQNVISPAPKVLSTNNKFICELCQISTTSQEHLDSHYAGAKHRKAMVNAVKSGIKPITSVIPPPVEPAESILASVIAHRDLGSPRARNVTTDLSIYRTPSGQFYCHPCNTTVNSEKSFKEHTESKRHKFKAASAKRL